MSASTDFKHPAKPIMFCMAVTGMAENGNLDEGRIRAHLQRQVDAGVGVYLGSGGSGDGHSLDVKELGELYRIGVDVCKGKVPVYCNPPEARTAKEMIEKAQQAVDAGVDCVQYYQVDMGHGSMPALEEQETYYRDILEAIDYPCALSMHPLAGYVAPPAMVGRLSADYPHVKVINYLGPQMKYFADVKAVVQPDVKLYTGMAAILPGLIMGCWGAQVTEPNQIPNISQSVIDYYLAGDMEKMQEAYTIVLSIADVMALARAESSGGAKAGAIAMGYDVGPPRKPRVAAKPETIEKMRQAFAKMNLAELEKKAAARKR